MDAPTRKAWTKADDDAIRRRYPARGPALGADIGRSAWATQRRASTLGVRFARRPPPRRAAHAHVITEDLIRWAERKARRYARRYGDPDDRYGACTSLAMVKAQRSFDPARGVPFDAYVRTIVLSKLELAKLHGGVSGFRRTGTSGRREGAPSVYYLAPEDDDRESGIPPVGWDVDYADLVDAMARKVPGIHADVLRLMYLDCRGADVGTAARAMGLTRARTETLHREAIERLRRVMVVLPDEARELFRGEC